MSAYWRETLFRPVIQLVRHRALPLRHRLRDPAAGPPRTAGKNRRRTARKNVLPTPPAQGGKSKTRIRRAKNQQHRNNDRLPRSAINHPLRSLIQKRAACVDVLFCCIEFRTKLVLAISSHAEADAAMVEPPGRHGVERNGRNPIYRLRKNGSSRRPMSQSNPPPNRQP